MIMTILKLVKKSEVAGVAKLVFTTNKQQAETVRKILEKLPLKEKDLAKLALNLKESQKSMGGKEQPGFSPQSLKEAETETPVINTSETTRFEITFE